VTSTEVVVVGGELVRDAPEVRLSNSDLQMIRRQVAVPRGGQPPTDVDLDTFARVCMAQRLNPFDRQIYLAHIGGRWQPFIGVHGRLVIALRTGQVDGMEGPYFCGPRVGVERDQPPRWDELWDGEGPPHAAKFVVYRKGWTRFPVGIAQWRYYAFNAGTARTGTWQSNPSLMLGYKAITRALNLVFPDVLPPAPERPSDEPDVDEGDGYRREDPPPPGRQETGAHRGAMIDGRGLGAEFGLTNAAVHVQLRHLAADIGRPPPDTLDAVDADLVDAWREVRLRDDEEEPF